MAVRLLPTADAGPADLLAADAYVFACPNLAAVSGVMKDFFDPQLLRRARPINSRAFLLLVCASSDGHNAVRQMGASPPANLKASGQPLIVLHRCANAIPRAQDPAQGAMADCRALGEAVATGLEMGIF